MDDNARPHRTQAVEELLESEDITRMDWPAYSPHLNPIEHVWDGLGRRIAARLHHPENTQQLEQMLIEEWALLPQKMLHQLVLSMRRRCEVTIAILNIHWCAKIKDEVEKLAYQLNEEAERTEIPIRRLSKVMYGSTCADMQVDVMGECLSSIKHVVGVRSVFLAKRLHAV
ncbi:transposable element Tcb2 transposase [Trichonephila clavipes]|nr:transposable element Tcb2 transposase [Trichonephila clavipes]